MKSSDVIVNGFVTGLCHYIVTFVYIFFTVYVFWNQALLRLTALICSPDFHEADNRESVRVVVSLPVATWVSEVLLGGLLVGKSEVRVVVCLPVATWVSEVLVGGLLVG